MSLLLRAEAAENIVDRGATHCAPAFVLPSGPEAPHIALFTTNRDDREWNMELTIAECVCHLLNLTITHVPLQRNAGKLAPEVILGCAADDLICWEHIRTGTS